MGKSFGKWEVIEQITEGGQTWVYKVRSSDDSTVYTLKRLKKQERLGRFENELKARSKLEHAHIVDIVDSDLSAAEQYYVEKYFPDGDLSKNRDIFEGDLTATLKLFLQVCDAVAHAHKHGVIHRDIKPQNVLVDRENRTLHLTDFGVCYTVDGDQQTVFGEQVGSRFYMSPEMSAGIKDAPSPASDVYSLGKLLYWMISGVNLDRERHRDKEFDLAQRMYDRHCERVSKLLDRMIVESSEKRVHDVEWVKKRVRLMIPLIAHEFNVVSTKVYQRCIYCGIGNYNHVCSYDPKRDAARDGRNKQAFGLFLQHGIKFEENSNRKWDLLVCELCGNVQYFVRDPNNCSWEDPKYDEPDHAE